MEVFKDVVLAVCSFAVGFGFTRWWERARPLLLLQGFGTFGSTYTDVSVDAELEQQSTVSWFVDDLYAASSGMKEISDARTSAAIGIELLRDALDKLPLAVASLNDANDEEGVEAALEIAIRSQGISDGLSLAAKWKELRIQALDDLEGREPILSITFSATEHDGCYQIAWKTGHSRLSSNLEKQPFLRPRLEPLINAMRYLDRAVLLDVFAQLGPLLESQLAIAESIESTLDGLLEGVTHWAARILVANYGGSPMVVRPDATIQIEHRNSNASFTIPSQLVIADRSGARRRVTGVHVLAPGEKLEGFLISSKIQRELPDGAVLRTHFNQKDSLARVCMMIVRRGPLGRSTVKSGEVVFASDTQDA